MNWLRRLFGLHVHGWGVWSKPYPVHHEGWEPWTTYHQARLCPCGAIQTQEIGESAFATQDHDNAE
jgi:hypothetical protein